MRIGIIAEGPADLAVLRNILRGHLGIDREDVQFLRPEYGLDETDLHTQPIDRYSNWLIVKEECQNGGRLEEFLNSPIDEERLVVIHIDTAECEEPGYDVPRPPHRDAQSIDVLRERVLAQIRSWLGDPEDPRLRYAIAVEETDAWVLTIDTNKDETGLLPRPKETLKHALNRTNRFSDAERRRLFRLNDFRRADALTCDFCKHKRLHECAARNRSLQLFLRSLDPPASTSQSEEQP